MNKRRSIIAAFLVVAILAIGVGYAAVSDTLSIGGMIAATQGGAQNQFDVDVYFLEATVTPNNCTVTLSDDADRATINMSTSTDLAHTGDSTYVVIPVYNGSVYDATLEIDDRGVDDAGIEVVYALYADEAASIALSPSEIAAGSTVYLKVTFTIDGDPTEADITTTLDMIMTATSK